MTAALPARDLIRAYVERIERMNEEIAAANADKRDIYAEAKANGLDAKALKAVVVYRRKDIDQAREEWAMFEMYLSVLQGGTGHATRAGARSDDQRAGAAGQ